MRNVVPVLLVILLVSAIGPSARNGLQGAVIGAVLPEHSVSGQSASAATATSDPSRMLMTDRATGANQRNLEYNGRQLSVPGNELGFPPHPDAVQADSPPPSYGGHYYAGSVYSGSATTATQLQVTVQIPDDYPEGSSFYYVILSVWDNAGSYDQIGFTNDEGTWGLAYSWTSYCAANYYYSPDALTLQRGQSYDFDMFVSSGYVDFAAFYESNATIAWSYSADTGGTAFEVAESYSCDSGSSYDYTDYEEVYNTTGPVVPYDFLFTYNFVGTSLESSWSTWSSDAPSGVNALLNSYNVTIENEPYYLYFTNGLDSTAVEPTASPRTFFWNVTVGDLSADSPIDLAGYYAPGSWSLSIQTLQGDPTFTSEFSFSFPSTTTPGLYYIGIVAFDGSGSYDRVALDVDVLPGLTASPSGSPGSGQIDVGQSMTLSANAGGGSGVYTYQWTAVPLGCSVTATATAECTPSSAGSFSISVTVTDSLGYTATGALLYSVQTDPVAAVPTAAPGIVDVGQPITFLTTATGGSGGYTYSWRGLPLGCSSSGTASDLCIPTGAGTFSITVAASDSNKFVATSGALSYTVDTDPTVNTISTPAASDGVDVGESVTFSAAAAGGSGSYTYAWFGLPGGCVGTTTPSVACVPTAAGALSVTANVTDSNGFTETSRVLSFTVYTDPAVSSFMASPANILQGTSMTFETAAAGGRAPLTYSYLGLPAGCSSTNASSLVCTPSAVDTFTVEVIVLDANGFKVTQNTTLTVNPEVLGLPAVEGYAVIGGVAALAAAIAAVVTLVAVRRRRQRGPTTTVPP
jgi:hypothetical protein